MHKLAKGLKKKKKQKKGKKGEDDEEFEPEELERYRRERAEAQQKLEEASGEQGAAAGSDAWQKFEALTSGVDSILKKTQDDLDRIKSTSFFQRKAPEPEPDPEDNPEVQAKKQELARKYVGFDKDGNPIELKEEEHEEKDKSLKVTKDGFVEVSDDEEEHEDSAEEDIFDTTYLDVLENIDVQLAYIPDSPTQEELGDDPFDTSNADKVLKTVDKTGKKLVSLGNAVEVLSGRVDYVSTCKIGRNRPRPKNQDLLLGDDEEFPPVSDNPEAASEPVEVEKSLLDDDCDLPDIPIDLTKLPPVLTRPVTPANAENNHNDENKPLDISEFEFLKDKTILDEIPVLDDEEFDLNAPAEPVVLEEADDPFAEKHPENIEVQDDLVEVSFEAATFVNEEDPFDTTIADNILPGKTELKVIEKELEDLPVSEVSISLTDPCGLHRDYETGLLKGKTSTLTVAKKDLLGGSVTDLSQLADEPIKPVEEITYVDPFDTSAIQEVPPGQTELKFLEKELLGETKKTLEDLDDDDFDPRAGETPSAPATPKKPPPPRPPPVGGPQPPKPPTEVRFEVRDEDFEVQAQTVNKARKPSRPEALDISPKVVAFELPTPKPDLLASGEEEKSLPGKPLTPYYPQRSLEEDLPTGDDQDEAEVDPFDTSFVAKNAPGKTELKLIESELLKEEPTGIPHSLSDHDFDPRAGQAPPQNRRQSDFGTVTGRPNIIKSSEVIESLVNKRKALDKRQDSILDSEVEVTTETLAPNVKPTTIEEEIEQSYKDPFDTSHAEVIAPGKAELKLLERELSEVPEPAPIKPHPVIEQVIKKRVVEEDPDFDPRAGEPKQDILCLDAPDAPTDKVLTPLQGTDVPEEDVDPFDTSFASIDPGKTELKLLESELINK